MDSTNISKEAIRAEVDRLLKETGGVKCIPDWAEKALYTNICTIMLRVLDSALNSAKISMLGHEIAMDLRPAEKKALSRTSSAQNLNAQMQGMNLRSGRVYYPRGE